MIRLKFNIFPYDGINVSKLYRRQDHIDYVVYTVYFSADAFLKPLMAFFQEGFKYVSKCIVLVYALSYAKFT